MGNMLSNDICFIGDLCWQKMAKRDYNLLSRYLSVPEGLCRLFSGKAGRILVEKEIISGDSYKDQSFAAPNSSCYNEAK